MAINPETLRAERELHAWLQGVTDAQTRAITEAWVVAWDAVVGELEASIQEMAAAAGPGKRVTRTMVIRNQRAQAALEALRLTLQQVAEATHHAITPDLWAAITQAGEAQYTMIETQLGGEKRAGFRQSLIRADPVQVGEMVRRATEQITALSLPLAADTYQVVRRELLRGISVGANPRTAARRMLAATEDRYNFGLSRALNIARTEMLDATRRAAKAVDDANASVLAGWVWVAHLDGNTCRSCIAQHGTLHPLNEEGPLDHQSGRCARVPKTKTWEELGFKGISDPPDSLVDADAWFARQSEATQRSILGNRGYEAWQRGEYPKDQWSSRRTTDGWRDSFAPSRQPA